MSLWCVKRGLGPWIPGEKIYVRSTIKTVKKKVASTKQFIEGKVHYQGGKGGRFCEAKPAPMLFWDWLCLLSLGWKKLSCTVGGL